MSLTKVSYSMIEGEVVNVLDFGADATGATDCQPAVQAALAYLFANGKNTLYFPDGNFYFATPLTVTFTVGRSLRIVGTSCGGMTSGVVPPGGTRLQGAAGIESIILLTCPNLATPIFYGSECSNINFQQDDSIVLGAVSAIKNLVGYGPNRPFTVKNCTFTGFAKALSSDLTQAQALDPSINTGVCVALITLNSFYYNSYALYGKGLGAWMNLNFVSNNCEQNFLGGIFTENLGIAAACNISDNLLEGQPNAIVLDCGLAMVNIERNYFEGNTGSIVDVTCSNYASQVRCVNNYNISAGTAKFSGCMLECDTTIPKPFITNILGKSKISYVTRFGGSETFNTISLDVNTISKLTSVTPFTVAGMGYSAVSASPEVTPIGTKNVENVSTLGSVHNVAQSVPLNGYVVFQALVRQVAGITVYINLLNSASVSIGNSDTGFAIQSVQKGDWLYVQVVIKANAPSGASFKYRWISDGTIDVTDTYVYVIPAQSTIGETMICLPN